MEALCHADQVHFPDHGGAREEDHGLRGGEAANPLPPERRASSLLDAEVRILQSGSESVPIQVHPLRRQEEDLHLLRGVRGRTGEEVQPRDGALRGDPSGRPEEARGRPTDLPEAAAGTDAEGEDRDREGQALHGLRRRLPCRPRHQEDRTVLRGRGTFRHRERSRGGGEAFEADQRPEEAGGEGRRAERGSEGGARAEHGGAGDALGHPPSDTDRPEPEMVPGDFHFYVVTI